MAKLQPDALQGKTLGKVLTILGKKFLDANAVLRSYEELEAGISYNYKVEFGDKDGDKEFILKVDNPTVGMRANNKDVSGDKRPDDKRFNLIARFINKKVESGLQAPAFLPVIGKDGEFCVIADKNDAELPEEFRGVVVSLQPFSAKGEGVDNISSPSEARSLGDNLGKLHRPSPLSSPLSEGFPVPLKSPQVADSIRQREQLEIQFGKTKLNRQESYITSSEAVGSYMTRLASSSEEGEEKKLYTEMLKYFPNNQCSPETLALVIETACASQPKQDLSIWQISHNDLHGGNMLVGDTGVTLIDFDELGRAGVAEDLWKQIEPLLDIFNREEAIKNQTPKLPKQALLEEFLCGYLAHNPYLSRSEFQAVEDLTIMNVARIASGDLAEMVKLATSTSLEKPTGEDVRNLTNRISRGDWMPAFLADIEKQKEEKDLLGATYDKVFTEISRGTYVESLTDRSRSAKARDPLAHYDLAMVTRQKGGGSESSNGGAGR